MGGQTQYNLTPTQATPGMLMDNERSNQDIVSVLAASAIPFGVLCELTSSGTAQVVQDATTGGSWTPNFLGVSVFDAVAVEQTYTTFPVPPSGTGSSVSGWPTGVSVPFLRRGRIWASWDGNTGVAYPRMGAIQVWHSSTGANSQGVFTTKAAQTTAGAEIDNAPSTISVYDPTIMGGAFTDEFGNSVNIIGIQINLPGKS